MRRYFVYLAIGICFIFSTAAYAFEAPNHPICVERHSDDYPTAAAAKLLCGAFDVGFGWTEIFWYPSVSDNKVTGVAMGPVRMVGRMLTGAAEVLTFWIPNVTIKKLSPECAIAIIKPKKP